MKKILATLALSVVIFNSCEKKNEPADSLTQTAKQETEVTPAKDDMLKEAQSKPLTTLALSESQHSFGDIKKGETVEHVYEVTNTGTNPLIISNVKPGCGCTAPDFTREPIMPGKKGTVTLKFDSSNFDGPIQKQAELFANVEKAPVTISFTGTVVK